MKEIEKEQETKDKKYVLYLIRHIDIPQYTKIGYTSNLEQRVAQLNTSSPTGIEVIHTTPTDYARRLEQSLHKQYAKKHSHLEWFKLDEDDLTNIKDWLEKSATK